MSKENKKTNKQLPKAFDSKKASKRHVIAVSVALVVVIGLFFVVWTQFMSQNDANLKIVYPFDGSCFPPEIIAPIVWWQDTDPGVHKWRIQIDFPDNGEPITDEVDKPSWRPDKELWESIKMRSLEAKAQLTVYSLKRRFGFTRTVAKQTIFFTTSKDSVNAQIFYRDVPLPFKTALEHVERIKWRLGSISSESMPKTILTNLPVCGNCHTFSLDGKTLGMDVDIGNDKGAYILTPFQDTTVFSRDKLISWSDFDPNKPTFGMLANVSPSGRYVLAGLRDRSLFLPRLNKLFSQIFFPVMGILGYYDSKTGKIRALPGADDPEYVQSNGVWTPDEKYVIFARHKAVKLKSKGDFKNIILNREESIEVLGEEKYLEEPQKSPKKFCFELYRVPFNNGRGGKPEPIPGASNNGYSNYFAKVSPDGKWIVFTRAHSFMLLQPDSKLYIMPAEGGTPRLMNCNTPRMNSWHSWSPNGRWLVFSSKVFTSNTQLFLTHIDENGIDTPPVLLHNFTPLDEDRGANIPEFVNIKPSEKRTILVRFLDSYNYFRSGKIYEQFRMFEEAKEKYRQSLEMNPKSTFSRYGLATIYIKEKEYDKARKEYMELLKLDPKSATIHIDLGQLYFTEGKYSEAEAEFKKAVELDPNNVVAHYNLGSVYAKRGNIVAAEREYRTALSKNPEKIEIKIGLNFNLGSLYVQTNRFDLARRFFEEVIRLEPANKDALFNLGRIYKILKKYDKAVTTFTTLAELDPQNIEPHVELGELYMEQKVFNQAINEFIKVKELNPKNLYARICLGRIYAENGNSEKAEQEFQNILALDPENLYAHINLGLFYKRIGQKDRALKEFTIVQEMNPNDARVYFMIAEIFSDEPGKARDALQYLRKGLALQPDYIEGYLMLGNTYLKLGTLPEAIEAFEKALKLNPDEPGLREKVDELKKELASKK